MASALRQVGAQSIRHPGSLRYVIAVGRTRGERTRTVIALAGLPYPKWTE